MPVLQVDAPRGTGIVAYVPYSDRTPADHVQSHADQRLIAAAPELLEALKWALPLAEMALEDHRQARIQAGHSDIGAGSPHLGLWESEAKARDGARAAIAKATGAA